MEEGGRPERGGLHRGHPERLVEGRVDVEEGPAEERGQVRGGEEAVHHHGVWRGGAEAGDEGLRPPEGASVGEWPGVWYSLSRRAGG